MAFDIRTASRRLALLALFWIVALPLGAAEEPPGTPLVVHEADAFVDWTLPAIGVSVEADAPDPRTVARDLRRKFGEIPEAYAKRVEDERRLRTRAAAIRLAKERALPLLLAIRLDSTRTVADLHLQDPLAGLLGPKVPVEILREVWNERPIGSSLQIDARIAIWNAGQDSVGATLLKIIEAQLGEPSEAVRRGRNERARLREGEMVVFDARSASAVPALFPRVVTDEGEVIYNAAALQRKLLLERGPGSYAVMDEGAAIPTGASRTALPLVWVLPVTAVSKDDPATYVVRAADAKAFLDDPRRLAVLLSGSVRFLLRKGR